MYFNRRVFLHSNNTFKTVVLDISENKSKLICETDDFVFVSDCSTYQKHPCTYWLIKQEECHMLQEELEYLRKLQNAGQWTGGGVLTIYRKCWRKWWC